MLVFILFSFLLLAPALQGVWDFRTQFVFEAAVFLTGGFWLFREKLAGRLTAFITEKRNIPLFFAAFFSLLAAILSPVRALVMPEWWVFAAGLFILVLAGRLEAEGRRRTDLALRFSAWLVALLSLYQAFILKSPEITASLTNPNALALFTLMLLPLAIMWKDSFLLGALIITLVWTQSAAALLALLVSAGFYAKDNMKADDIRKNWPLLLLMAVVAALAFSLLESRSFLDRLGWWRAALDMFAARPALGFGPGSFAYVYPAFHVPHNPGLSTTYVHNYYLEFLAENGSFAFVFWGWAVAARFREAVGLKKYALIAVLAHSVTDFGLAVPANFFVFCYLLSGPRTFPEAANARGMPLQQTSPDSKRISVVPAVLLLACFAALCGVFSSQLKLERNRAGAFAALAAGDQAGAEALLEDAARLAPGNPLVPGLLGRIRLRAGLDEQNTGRLFTAAVELERAVVMNPYNAGAWNDLERLYAAVGEQRLLDGLRKRKAEVFQ